MHLSNIECDESFATSEDKDSLSNSDGLEISMESQSWESFEATVRNETEPIPMFYPTICVKKTLDYTTELYDKLDEIRDSKEFPIFVNLLGKKFADFAREIEACNPPKYCDSCDKTFRSLGGLVKHILSRKHIEQMWNMGNLLDYRDLQLIIGVYEEATSIYANMELAGDDELESVKKTQEKPSNKNESTAKGSLVRSNVRKLTSSEKRNLLNIPLLYGSKKEILSEDELSALLSKARELHELNKEFALKSLKGKCRENRWTAANCILCPKDFTIDFMTHVLSQEHLDKLKQEGVFPSRNDFESIIKVLESSLSFYLYSVFSNTPFANGTKNVGKRLPAKQVSNDLSYFSRRLAGFHPDTIKEVLVRDCGKLTTSINCPRCEVEVNSADWIHHLLTLEHIKKMEGNGRFVSFWDVGRLNELLVKMKKLEEKTKESEKEEPNKEWW